ncbi:MAG: c-type cytochrome [Deltaproteobacteria bacterium]|nr:c-type cytochrome [Deltaproteobacteria bacterium]
MSEQQGGGNLLNHDYDGIREYDNPQPAWWTWIFVASIIFSVGYAFYYHLGGPGLSETEAYALEAKEAAERAAKLAPAINVTEELLAQTAKDEKALAAGKETFMKNCLACHTATGAGLVGPNLTDLFQIHGSTRIDIYNTIYNGVLAKGMVAWGKVLKPKQLLEVAAYATSLRGKNLPGKAAEGKKVEPW